MESTSHFEKLQGRKKTVVSSNICSLVYNIAVAIASFVIYANEDDGSCDRPLKTWILVNGVACTVGFLLTIMSTAATVNWKVGLMKVSTAFLSIYLLFTLVWFILGNVWLWGSDTCEDEYEVGYTFIEVILIIQYVALGLAVCFCCCFACLGIVAAVKAKNG